MNRDVTISTDVLWEMVKYAYEDGQRDWHDESLGFDRSFAAGKLAIWLDQYDERSIPNDMSASDIIRSVQSAVERSAE